MKPEKEKIPQYEGGMFIMREYIFFLSLVLFFVFSRLNALTFINALFSNSIAVFK